MEPDLDASQLMTDFSVLASVVVGGEHLMCDVWRFAKLFCMCKLCCLCNWLVFVVELVDVF